MSVPADHRITRVRDGVYRVTVAAIGLDGPFEMHATFTTLSRDAGLPEAERLARVEKQAAYAANKLRRRASNPRMACCAPRHRSIC